MTEASQYSPAALIREDGILFLDFKGVGNGISLIPLLMCLETTKPGIRYHVADSPVFAPGGLAEFAGLRGCASRVPSVWRRASPEHHQAILTHLRSHGISTIVNLRNEGPAHDVGYFELKAKSKGGVHFLDLFDRPDEDVVNRRLRTAHRSLFERAGVCLDEFEPDWLAGRVAAVAVSELDPIRVGLVTMAGQASKRWPADQWVELAVNIRDAVGNDVAFSVYAGEDAEERPLAVYVHSKLRNLLGHDHVTLHAGLDLVSVAAAMAQDAVVVSNDTGLLHLATALGKPVVGLYLATIGEIWAPDVPWVHVVQSPFGRGCMFQKAGVGNCSHFYGGCPAPCRGAVSARTVLPVVRSLLGQLDRVTTDHPAACLTAVYQVKENK